MSTLPHRVYVTLSNGAVETGLEGDLRDVPLKDVRARCSQYYNYSGLRKKPRDSLKAAGFHLIRDLEGKSHYDLMKFNGIGPNTARDIIRVAKALGVQMYGEHDIVVVQIALPIETSLAIKDRVFSKEDVETYIKEDLLKGQSEIARRAKEARLQKIQDQIAQMKERERALKKELEGHVAQPGRASA